MLKVIDLFSGAGGLSLGFEQAGFRITKAVENNKWAQETYRQNHHKGIELFDDIVGLNFKNEDVDIVVGGPPCQGFSNANRNRSTFLNSNNLLIKEYFRVINEVAPKMFVMENVSSILSETHLFFVTNQESENFRELSISFQEKTFALSDREEQIEFFSEYVDLKRIKVLLFKYKFPNQIISILKTLNKKTEKEKQEYLSKNKSKLIKALSLIKVDSDNLFYVYLNQLSQVLEKKKKMIL